MKQLEMCSRRGSQMPPGPPVSTRINVGVNVTELEKFTQLVLEGKTIKELQAIFGWNRTQVTEYKRVNKLVGLSPNSKKLDRSSGHKLCLSCNKQLPFTMFYSNGKTATGLIKYKPTCISCENTKRKSNFESLVKDYLSTKSQKYECVKCTFTGVFGSLDFHHTNPIQKDFSIGELHCGTISVERFMDIVVPELEKCVLLCPNCHRQEHLLMGLKGFDWAISTEVDN